MAEYGVTDTGFKRKPKSVVIKELGNLMKAEFGQDLDISPESPEGQIISVIANAVDPLWQVAEHSYNAFNPNGATGVTLENLVRLNNLKKKKATATTVTLTFTGTDGTLIPSGLVVRTNPTLTGGVSYKFDTTTSGVITGGIFTTLAVCQEVGAIQLPIGSVTILDTAVVGSPTVTNVTVGNVGQNEETDPELRARREIQVSLPSVSTTDSIVAGINNIETVLSVVVYDNDTGSDIGFDGVTVSPHSLYIIVQGDNTPEEKLAIAQTIYIRKDPGIIMDGLVTQNITDSQGFIKSMKWNNPTLVPIWIEIETNATISTALPGDSLALKQAIVDYVNDPVTGFKIGDNVSYARLYTPINSIPDHNVQSLKIGFNSSPTGVVDLDINGASLATVAIANINVIPNYPT